MLANAFAPMQRLLLTKVLHSGRILPMNIIKQTREDKKLTLYQAEQELGIHHDTIWKHENGHPVSLGSIRKYHAVWGTPIDALMALAEENCIT